MMPCTWAGRRNMNVKTNVSVIVNGLMPKTDLTACLPFLRQKVSAAECRIRNGALRIRIFRGLQGKLPDTHRASGKAAMYEHKC